MMSGFKFIGYKSFTNEYAELIDISNVTVFIGRNNSGKSSCIDMVESFINPNVLARLQWEQKDLKIEVEHIINENDIKQINIFDNPTMLDTLGVHIGKKVNIKVTASYLEQISDEHYSYEVIPNNDDIGRMQLYINDMIEPCHKQNFSGYQFRRLNADRDIVAEAENDDENVDSNGRGVTNLVRKFLCYDDYNEFLIENELMDALNWIVFPDSKFTNIKIQRSNEEQKNIWEIFLQEGSKKRYALSKMGSGLKTIILVLINLLVIPHTKGYEDQKFIYAFEELENNLHPALQRRLFDYLYDYSIEKGVKIFLTTHSHVAINGYYDKENARIYHVIKKDGVSSLYKIEDYIAKVSLLDDLDVKASDLLQSNGVIWVEGPSDRVYIKKWLEVFGEKSLQEGRDYQILYYGGRMLYHYSVDDEQKELLNVLVTNRNAAIIIDSDNTEPNKHINDTKKRVKEEFEKYEAFCWITQGKEIENYIPYAAIQQAYTNAPDKQCQQYELFPKYIKAVCPNFNNEKVKFAQKVCQYVSAENSSAILDLKEQMDGLIATIKKWNCK